MMDLFLNLVELESAQFWRILCTVDGCDIRKYTLFAE